MSTPERGGTAGKGRPTPKRNASSRRRTGPVAPPPRTRKEAAQRRRTEHKDARGSTSLPLAGGGPRLLKRDLGPVRALVRDVVDGRRTLAVLTLPLALLVVLANLSGSVRLRDVTFTIWVLGLLAVLIDSVLTSLTIARRVRATFPQEGRLARHVGYGLLRSTVFRRWRVPRPQVSPKPLRG